MRRTFLLDSRETARHARGSVRRSWQVLLGLVIVVVMILWLAHPQAAAVAQTEEPASAPALSRQAQLVIDTTRDMNPTTTLELLRAVINLLNVDANDAARIYFDKLLTQKPQEQALATIYNELGAAAVIRLAREPVLAPEGVALSRQIISAANQAARDPQRLAALIKALESERLDDRLGAAHKLAEGRELAAAALLQAMADPDRGKYLVRYRSAWQHFDQTAIPPLVAALRCSDGALQYPALLALEDLGSQAATPHLIGFAAATRDATLRATALRALQKITGITGMPADAGVYLEREVMQRLKGSYEPSFFPVDPAADRRRIVWSWAPKTHQPTIGRSAPRTIELMEANRLAHDLTRLETGYGRLYRVSELALLYALNESSPDALIKMATDRLAASGQPLQAAALGDALAWALRHDIHEAAIAACTLLGHLGDDRVLHTEAATRSPLVAALRSPGRAVRDAAAVAIMQIQPTQPFLGAADFVPIVISMATTGGLRKALVIHPVEQEAADLTGLLGGASWNATAVSTGKAALRALLESNDFELILLSDAIRQPGWTELLQQLRFDRRTAEIPLVVISRRGELSSVRALVAPFAPREKERLPVQVAPFPYDGGTLAVLLNRTVGMDRLTSSAQREANAKAAMEWLTRATADLTTFGFYELPQYDERLTRALWNPQLTEAAARTLGQLGTPTAQTALRQAIDSYPPETAAGRAVRSALAEAVQRRGVLFAP